MIRLSAGQPHSVASSRAVAAQRPRPLRPHPDPAPLRLCRSQAAPPGASTEAGDGSAIAATAGNSEAGAMSATPLAAAPAAAPTPAVPAAPSSTATPTAAASTASTWQPEAQQAPSKPQRMNLRSFSTTDDGPPRVMSLLDPAVGPQPNDTSASPARQHLPLLLYLPGVDGTGLAASRQFPSLLRKFDMRVLVTPLSDRTPFKELVAIVADYLRQEVPTCSPTRPVYVLGESFGGVMALALAVEAPSLVDRLVLVNPATSFKDSLWPVLGPLLPQMPLELYRALPLALAPVLGNPINLLSAGLEGSAGASLQSMGGQLFDTATNLLQQLPVLADILPAETLAWKLELLRQGSEVVEPLLPRVQQRCFLLVGDMDLLIPSAEEGPRLQRLLPRAQLRVENGRSHALLQEGGVDLAAILEEEGFYVRQRRMSAPISKRSAAQFAVAAPVELPTPVELQRYAERTTAFGRRLSSPVFISTAPDGRRSLGLGQIPEGRPLLLVGNHQTLALDLGVIAEQFLKEQSILLRGLAHPVIFAQSFGGSSGGEEAQNSNGSSSGSSSSSNSSSSIDGTVDASGLPAWDPIETFGDALANGGLNPLRTLLRGRRGGSSGSSSARGGQGDSGRSAFREVLQTFGAVPVSAFNIHRLLSNGEAVLLFPGGVREAYKRQGEEYQLFWPKKSEFIRMAARFGATIVPFAAVGVDDSLNILADSTQLEGLPVVGDMLRKRAGSVPQARKGVSATGEVESFVSPLVAPKLPPGRLYFLFQKPIQTEPEDMKDRQRCDDLYRATQASVEDGISFLLDQRQRDPYKDFLPRQLYEAAYKGRQAPTFPVN